jgi:hypothetical protein
MEKSTYLILKDSNKYLSLLEILTLNVSMSSSSIKTLICILFNNLNKNQL